MPIYTYQCQCGRIEEAFRHIAQREDAPECHGPMQKILTPTAVFADLPAYQSPITGREVRGRRARHDDLRRHGCRPWEGRAVEEQIAKSHRDTADAKFDKGLEAALHHTLSHMDSAKRDALSQ